MGVNIRTYDERMTICRACPELKRKFTGPFCLICGCNMKIKAQNLETKCPLGKW